ncbi:trypsin inhibitor-like [Achroia grisella]|uniref:trypsin inhibitor-like n=1 Tax=Achroia grisella TaxID=688607 RepID=UPI0027D2FA66|nr:trypsin inhibitor-like [Achroia grisella]
MGRVICFFLLAVSIYCVTVSAEDICSLELRSGLCFGYMPRYGYNVTTKKCEEFIYTGCNRNENNFETLEECQKRCE